MLGRMACNCLARATPLMPGITMSVRSKSMGSGYVWHISEARSASWTGITVWPCRLRSSDRTNNTATSSSTTKIVAIVAPVFTFYQLPSARTQEVLTAFIILDMPIYVVVDDLLYGCNLRFPRGMSLGV